MSLFVISFESDIISYWILLINELNNIIDMCSFYIRMRVMLLPFLKKLFFISFRDLPPVPSGFTWQSKKNCTARDIHPMGSWNPGMSIPDKVMNLMYNRNLLTLSFSVVAFFLSILYFVLLCFICFFFLIYSCEVIPQWWWQWLGIWFCSLIT